MYSKPIQQLINSFSKLPSVGQRTAERYVFHLLKSGKKEVAELTLALKELMKNVTSCKICWDLPDKSPCAVCGDKRRNQSIICVIAEPQDAQALEKTGGYNGLYHILRGTIKADEPENIKKLKIGELIKKIHPVKSPSPQMRSGATEGRFNRVKEIILAFNPDLEGETTMMYLQKEIKKANSRIKVTRLARGLPLGSDLQYSDEITLASALKNRT